MQSHVDMPIDREVCTTTAGIMLVVGTRMRSTIPGHEWERDTQRFRYFERWVGVEVAPEAQN